MFHGDLLIDGYNLLHAAGLARRSYGPGEFERTRRRLLRLLADQLFDRERRRTTVVFDAPVQSLGPSPPSTVHGIRVIFADGDGDADAAIERLILQNSAPRRLHVISSDHRVQRAAKRRRAKFFDSDAFLIRIARRPTPQERAQLAEPPEKRDGLTSAGEVNAWLQAFADVEDVRSPVEPKPSSSAAEQPTTGDADSGTVASTPQDEALGQDDTPAIPDDLSFWESRIAELWNQTDDEVGEE